MPSRGDVARHRRLDARDDRLFVACQQLMFVPPVGHFDSRAIADREVVEQALGGDGARHAETGR